MEEDFSGTVEITDSFGYELTDKKIKVENHSAV
jgi:hypothetical protein